MNRLGEIRCGWAVAPSRMLRARESVLTASEEAEMALPLSPHTVAPRWDRVVSIVLLALLPVVAVTSSFFAIVSVMGSAVCGPNDCDTDVINAGGLIAGFLPWFIFVVASVVVTIALVRRRRAFWYAIAAFLLAAGAGAGGVMLVFSVLLGRNAA